MGFKSLTTGNTFKISENVLKVAQNKYRDIFEDDDCQNVLNVDSIIDSSKTNFQGICIQIDPFQTTNSFSRTMVKLS